MSAPPMEVYQFEDQFERAVQAHLLANGVNDVAKQRDSKIQLQDGSVQILKTPRAEVKLLVSGPYEDHKFVSPTGETFLDIWMGTAYVKIVTRRDVAEPSHAFLRGLCRYLMQKVSAISALMKFHSIEKMIEQQSSITFDADKLHDVSSLSFTVWLRIRNSFFPTS